MPEGLDRLLSPGSIALVGASNNVDSIGGWVFANLARAFAGTLHPIHPRDEEVQGRPAYRSISALPAPVDLAVVVVPAPSVPAVIEECADKGVGGAVVITSGFAESGPEGAALQDQLSSISRRSGVRVVGPNCIGFMNLFGGVMANFAIHPTAPLPEPGPVALVSQSGGFGSYIATKAFLAGLRLGWFVSTGNEADVNIAGVIRHLVERDEVQVVMVFSETLRDPDVFIEAACIAVERDKPVVLLKAGRSDAAAKAALSHTASIVGSSGVFDSVASQYGVFVVDTMEAMLDLGMIFQDGRRVRDRRVAILTSSGGAGVLLADACTSAGLSVPELPPAERQLLLDIMPKPFYGSTANPVDTTAQVVNSPGTFEKVLAAVGNSESVDMLTPVTWAMPGPFNDALIEFYKTTTKAVALTSTAWLDDFQRAGVPTYTDPQRAADALGALAAQSLRPFAPTRPGDWRPDDRRIQAIRPLLDLPAGRRALLESASKQVIAAYGVPVTVEELVASTDEAVRAAHRLGTPVALKVMSYDLPHKTEVGALRVGVIGDDAVRRAYEEMLEEVARRAPEAAVEGVLVQEMVPGRIELACGIQRDDVFGPVVAVGAGGVLVEVLGGAELLRPPFSDAEALAALSRVFGGRLVRGRRGLVKEERDAVGRIMVSLGQLALELDEVREVDVNPIVVDAGSARAVDALIVVA